MEWQCGGYDVCSTLLGMKKRMLLLLMGISVASLSFAGEPADPAIEPPRANTQAAGKNLWRASVAAVAAANVMDAGSSWGKRELNPGLSSNNGRFGGQGAILKLGIVGGVMVLESLVLRRPPSTKLYRRLALVNFGCATVTGAMAIRNLGIPRQ